MVDISQFTIAKSDQLNADDLVGKTKTITITKVTGNPGDQPVSVYFEGDEGKPYKPCKSMLRVFQHTWGRDASKYVGRKLTLYTDPAVKFGGLEVGGLRISHMSHIDKPVTMALTASKANKKPFTVKPLVETKAAEDTETPALVTAGTTAAAIGVASYTTWLATLTPEQKAKIKPHHAEWTRVAKAADEVTEQPLSEEPPL